MNTLLTKFKDYLLAENISAITIKNYLSDIRKFAFWYEKTYNREFHPLLITPAIIATFQQQISLADSSDAFHATRSVKRYLSSLRKLFSFLHSQGAIPVNPLEMVTVSKAKEQDPWKINEFKDFLYNDNASSLTIKNYILDIRQFLHWLEEVTNEPEKTIQLIDDYTVDEYKKRLVNDSGLSPVSINRKLSSLRRYIAWLNKKGLIQKEIHIYDIIQPKQGPVTLKEQPLFSSEPASPGAYGDSQLEELKKLQAQQQATQQQIKPKSYSSFPPLRFMQKSKKLVSLGLDTLILAPIVNATEAGKYQFWKLTGRKIFAPTKTILGISQDTQATTITRQSASDSNRKQSSANAAFLIEKFMGMGLSPRLSSRRLRNIPKSVYAPLKLSTRNMPLPQKLLFYLRHKRPQWYKKYQSYPLVQYFQVSIFLIFVTTTGFGIYNSFFEAPNKNKPVLAAPTAPPRVLSFQGRLTDSEDNPITAATNLRFSIYNSPTASGSALLWQEAQNLTPDEDGVFAALLGKGSPISQSLFANNSSLYLGVTVERDSELAPRQQLATVAYATNAETLQGLIPITQSGAGTNNVILALDSAGNLTIGGSAAPTFQATGGKFTISGRVLNLTTATGSNSNIQLAPDGTGIIDTQKALKNTTTFNSGAVQVDDIFAILATSSGQAAFNVNQNSSGPIISASTSGIAKFTVSNSGAGMFADSLTLKGNSLLTTEPTFNLINSTAGTINLGGAATSLSIGASSGTTTINHALSITGVLTTNGGLTIPSDKNLTVSGTINSDIIASASGMYDLGSSSTYWRNAYINNIFTSPTATASGFWQRSNGAIAPINTSDDFLVGGSSTASAKFAVLNMSTGTPTASISAQSGNYAIYATGDGTLATTNRGTLTIGNSSTYNTTGDILIHPNGTGRLGIGTTSPAAPFHLVTSSDASLIERSGGNPLALYNPSAVANDFSQVLFQLNNSSGTRRLYGTIGALIEDSTAGGEDGALIFKTAFNGSFGTEQMRLTSGGALGIRTTSPLATLDVRGNLATTPAASISANSDSFAAMVVDNRGTGDIFTASASGGTKFTIANTGNVTIVGSAATCTLGNGSSATNCSASDQRLKTDITSLSDTSGLEALNKLKPVSYNWNSWMQENGATDALQYGFIAQDVATVLPNLVTQDKNTGYFKLDYQGFFAPIVKAIQELDAKIKSGAYLATENITIGGQTIENYIKDIVTKTLADTQNTLFPVKIISPTGEISTLKTGLISPLASGSAIVVGGKVVIASDSEAISNNDLLLEVHGNASISGTLTVNRISADSIDGLDDKLATLAAALSQQSSNSTLYNSTATPSATLTPITPLVSPPPSESNYPLNTDFANISSLSAQLSADFGRFNQGLISLGPTSLAETWVNGDLHVGRNMVIGQTSIDTIGTDLNIQPLRQGNIAFMGGSVVIDTEGNLNVNGHAMFAKDVTVKGKLAANIIVPVPDQDIIVQLSGTKSNGESQKFEIKNASGSSVLAMNNLGDIIASGSGQFSRLAAGAFSIIRGAQADTSLTETVASSSAGMAVITANETERTIYTPYVTKDSLIYVTATSNPKGQTPYVARQTPEDPKKKIKGSFTVQLPASITTDIKFNWWILN